MLHSALSSSPTVSSSTHGQEPTIFIKNQTHPLGQHFAGVIPKYIPRGIPRLKAPATPGLSALRARTLGMLQPTILYVQFSCLDSCRSFGICIHYHFILGVKMCPDGLVCEQCVTQGAKVERGLKAQRLCPLHQISGGLGVKPISSRPEDFFVSREGRERARECLRRGRGNEWEDLRAEEEMEKEAVMRKSREETPRSWMDLQVVDRGRADEVEVVPSVPTFVITQDSTVPDLPTLPPVQEWGFLRTRLPEKQNTW